METISLGGLLLAFIAAMGIPSAVMGMIVRRLERKIVQREQEVAAQEKTREDMMVLLVETTGAAIALGEATAKAVQRIPDAHCNGDMRQALDYATEIKRRQKKFLAAQGIHAIWE